MPPTATVPPSRRAGVAEIPAPLLFGSAAGSSTETTIATLFDQVLQSIFGTARQLGMPISDVVERIRRPLAATYKDEIATLPLMGLGGRAELVGREGGCVPAKTAAALYLGRAAGAKRALPETVRKAAREGRLISIRDGHRDFLFPVWQFREDGGPLEGLAAVLTELRQRPGYSEITPFVFFLQPHPFTVVTPLEALRKGEIPRVIKAALSERD